MNNTIFVSIAGTGFVIAFLHAAIPTHWLPFVLAGRGQGWSRSKTLAVTALAGSGHVLFTTALGVLVAGLGIAVDRWTGNVFPWIAGGTLVAFGLFYLIRQARGTGHHHGEHGHHHQREDTASAQRHTHDHAHAHEPESAGAAARTSDRAAILGLFTLLTFSPCEGFLPVYLSGVAYGWMGFVVLSAVLASATLVGMMAFTWLTLVGLERLRLAFLQRYENGVLGGLLCLLGVAVLLFER